MLARPSFENLISLCAPRVRGGWATALEAARRRDLEEVLESRCISAFLEEERHRRNKKWTEEGEGCDAEKKICVEGTRISRDPGCRLPALWRGSVLRRLALSIGRNRAATCKYLLSIWHKSTSALGSEDAKHLKSKLSYLEVLYQALSLSKPHVCTQKPIQECPQSRNCTDGDQSLVKLVSPSVSTIPTPSSSL